MLRRQKRGCKAPGGWLEPVLIAGDTSGTGNFFISGGSIFAVNLAAARGVSYRVIYLTYGQGAGQRVRLSLPGRWFFHGVGPYLSLHKICERDAPAASSMGKNHRSYGVHLL